MLLAMYYYYARWTSRSKNLWKPVQLLNISEELNSLHLWREGCRTHSDQREEVENMDTNNPANTGPIYYGDFSEAQLLPYFQSQYP